jgi:hypothetical protein
MSKKIEGLRELKRGRLCCPDCFPKVRMHFEVFLAMFRINREGYYHAKCPNCKTEFNVKS